MRRLVNVYECVMYLYMLYRSHAVVVFTFLFSFLGLGETESTWYVGH
jgi:hypothetical protein